MDIRPLPEYIKTALNNALWGFLEAEYGLHSPYKINANFKEIGHEKRMDAFRP
jgi:hypothetical protein